MRKSLAGLIGAVGLLASIGAAQAMPALQGPARDAMQPEATLQPAQLIIAPRHYHPYHHYWRRPVYHRYYPHHYYRHRGPAIIIR